MGNGDDMAHKVSNESLKFPEFVKVMWEADGSHTFPNVTWMSFDRLVEMIKDKLKDIL